MIKDTTKPSGKGYKMARKMLHLLCSALVFGQALGYGASRCIITVTGLVNEN